MQFTYVNYKPPYKYTTQLGAILKREYPGLVEDRDEDGVVITRRPALEWADYFLNTELAMTSGERVLSEFWRLFKVEEDEQEEADHVLEKYLKKRVRDMMYQARIDVVKEYHRKQNQELDDILARPIELEYEQYMDGWLMWCSDEVWPLLCRYWCSKEFKVKRQRGQGARLNSEEIAQNHGGSRPFTETQQVLEAKFGPEKATALNVYAVMKSGIKSVDSNGRSGEIRSRKAQKRLDDSIAGASRVACPEGEDDGEEEHEQEHHLNAQVLYDVSSGLRAHGRFAIGNGAVRAADVRAAAKERSVRPSNQMSLESMAREMAHLHRLNARLEQENREKDSALQQFKITTEMTLGLYRELGKEIPESALQHLTSAQTIVSSQLCAIQNDNTHCSLPKQLQLVHPMPQESASNRSDVDGHDGEHLGGTHMDNNIDAGNHRSGNNESV